MGPAPKADTNMTQEGVAEVLGEIVYSTFISPHITVYLISKHAGVEIHSVRSHIRDQFVLEWKTMLKIVESDFKRVIHTTIWEWIPGYILGVDSIPNEVIPYMTPKEWISTPLH